jgi:excisionase family DNA binding protein
MQSTNRKPPIKLIRHAPLFEPLLDSDEAARLLRIHPKTLQKMARKGEITGIHIGKLWRFRASDLDKWIHQIAG